LKKAALSGAAFFYGLSFVSWGQEPQRLTSQALSGGKIISEAKTSDQSLPCHIL